MKLYRTCLLLAAATLVSGCGALLPKGRVETPGPFTSFAEAEAALQRVVPFRTRTAELAALGFDPKDGKNVTRIPYPDVLGRLVPYAAVPPEALDPGIRQCVAARAACQAWLFQFSRQDRERHGSFLADFFNVRRTTRITGWWLEALVVESDGVVLFRSLGGQPAIDRVERQSNPLGPFQSSGEGAGAVLLH